MCGVSFSFFINFMQLQCKTVFSLSKYVNLIDVDDGVWCNIAENTKTSTYCPDDGLIAQKI
jgi:hypothetical protein